MVDGQLAAAVVIGDQRQVGRVVGGSVRVHHRDAEIMAQRGPDVGPGADHDQAVDPAGEQGPQMVLSRIASPRASHRKTEVMSDPNASSAPIRIGMENRPSRSEVSSPTKKSRRVER